MLAGVGCRETFGFFRIGDGDVDIRKKGVFMREENFEYVSKIFFVDRVLVFFFFFGY